MWFSQLQPLWPGKGKLRALGIAGFQLDICICSGCPNIQDVRAHFL